MKTRVTIYSRPGCHLCEDAKEAMRAAGSTNNYVLEEINIATDRELLRRYKDDIPVITFDGVELFRHGLKSEEFAAALLTRTNTKQSS